MVSPELLRRFPFFAGLNEDQLRGIAMLSEEVQFPENTVILREGEPASQVYLVTAGSAELLFDVGIGHATEVYVGSVAPGEPFGVSALFDPCRVANIVRAESEVKAIAMDSAGLRAMCTVDCELTGLLMTQIARALCERFSAVGVQLAAQSLVVR